MGRWRPLPRRLDPQQRRLVERLRLMKDRTGLSLASLAAKTAYSRSSWQRYLSGDKPAPWQAVDALGRLAGEDRARLRVLWEVTVREPVGGAPDSDVRDSDEGTRAAAPEGEGTGPAPASVAANRQAAARGSRLTPATAAVASFTLALLFLLPGSRPQAPSRPEWPWALPSSRAAAGAGTPRCLGETCTGRDPGREGCAHDAHELSRGYGSVHEVRLLYSPRCHTVWAEVSSPGPGVAVSLSAPGKGLRQARTGAPRTVMIAVTDPEGSIACVVTRGVENCVNSEGESLS